MGNGISIGVYGKHPAWGDFVSGGLTETAQRVIETWLNKVLPMLRDSWGEGWGAWYDASPVIRFWFGADLVNDSGPLCGILVPSRDKVGRRYPLAVAVSGANILAPVQYPDQEFYDALLSYIEGFTRPDGAGGASLSDGLVQAIGPHLPDAVPDQEPSFWAARADGDINQLWSDVGPMDHQRASTGRSYVWTIGTGGAAVHVTRNLPQADLIGWLMRDAVGGPPEIANSDEDDFPEFQDGTVTADEPQSME